MHKSAIRFALKYRFRLAYHERTGYALVSSAGERIDCPAWGEHTAAGALRMMRRHVRQGRTDARAMGAA